MTEEVQEEIKDPNDIEIKLIKLDNNDLIIAQLCEHSYDEYNLIMIDPVHVQVHHLPYEGRIIETYSLKPWIPLSDEYVFDIPYDKILNISNPNEDVIDRYIDFLTDEETDYASSDYSGASEASSEEDDNEAFDEMVNMLNIKPDKPMIH